MAESVDLNFLGGYLLSFEQAASLAATHFDFVITPRNRYFVGLRRHINQFIKGKDDNLWAHRIQLVVYDDHEGNYTAMLIFPTVCSENPPILNSQFQETDGATPQVREAAHRIGMPDELFANFVTIRNAKLKSDGLKRDLEMLVRKMSVVVAE